MRPHYLYVQSTGRWQEKWQQEEKATAGRICVMTENEGGRLTKMGKWRMKIGKRNQSKKSGESFPGKTTKSQSHIHTVDQYVSSYCEFSHHSSPHSLFSSLLSSLLPTDAQNTSSSGPLEWLFFSSNSSRQTHEHSFFF